MTSFTGIRGRLVVTGAGGFLGRALVPELRADGWEVTELSLRDAGWKMRMPQTAHGIVHLAGLAHDTRKPATAAEHFRVNRDLTLDLFEAFRASAMRKFIFVSSIKAVTDAPGTRLVDEDFPPSPGTPYGRSKRAAEEGVLAAAAGRSGVYILRPAMIHGPGNKGNLNLLYRWAASGAPYPLAGFENRRSFLSVGNFTHVVKALCTEDVSSGVYNVCDDEAISTVEVMLMLYEALGKPARLWRLPSFAVRALAMAGDVMRLPFGTERLAKLTDSYCVDNRKIARALGQPLPVEARDGLRKTFEGFAGAGLDAGIQTL